MPAVLAFLIGKLPKVSGRLRKYSRFREPRTETSFDRDCRQPVWLNNALGSSVDFNQRVTGSIPVVPTTQSCRTGYFSVGLK